MDSSAGTAVAGITGTSLLVTGGGTGIGRAVALAAARHGARVTISGRRRDVLDDTAKTAAAEGLDLHTEIADVSDTASVDDLIAAVVTRQGGLDGVVNAAGVARFGPTEDLTDEDFLHVIDINLVGAFRVSRAAGRVMLANRRGSIVHIGSLTSLGGFAGRTAYGVSKHGVIGLTRTLAAEWGATGVRVNAVAPGFVRTPMTDRAITRGVLTLGHLEQRTPLGRRAEPEEMTGPILFLLSDAAGFVTGECLVADGGWTASVGPPTDFSAPRPL
ncbi:hypothetical protein GCM10009677_16420 [Sphaerisporangium rubeum]|uniref:SDR family NAD(P)-dependent oxidoreductase n=1 Tax=Sphaerisporangium rubeum TaxID=321317 RepID=UPI0031E0F94A